MLIEGVLLGAAGWRIAALLSYQEGPFRIFLRLRELLGIKHNDEGEPVSWPSGTIQATVSCIWCLSVYTVMAMWGLWQLEPRAVMVIAAMAVPPWLEKMSRG